MNIKNITTIFILLLAINVFSQENLYSSLTIPENLKQNANAVIRFHQLDVLLKAVDEMDITEKKIVTVLNKKGNDNIDAYVFYDDDVHIKELEVLVYNKFGALIKKIKEKDFKDVSTVDGGTLYSDSRYKYLEYTPIDYPYTIEFNCETKSSNTAFIPSFIPISDYFVSLETSRNTISYPETMTIRRKEKHTEGFEIKKKDTIGKIVYKTKNIEAYKPEDYSPSFNNIVPKVLFASNQFTLEGVYAEVEDWDTFGKWMYNDLIKDTDDLSESTKSMIQDLVKNETNDIDKAKKIYQYVQDKTRYISVQVGIGGWKPFNASEVDKLGYGDCKALTNYTMSLLKAAGIKSNYTVVFSGGSQRSLEDDFAVMQGDHIILNIPTEEDDIWLDCTSQKLPFGFIGDFTDDRDVLVITPEGGRIKHSKKYTTNENSQTIKARFSLSDQGNIDMTANIVSKGIQYNNKYWVETETDRDLDAYYKNRWRYINNIIINKKNINNNKDSIVFTEDINFTAANYSKIVGNRMLFTVNALNRNTDIPDRYRTRKYPLKINRGFIDIDEVEIKLPQDYKIESLPNKVIIENKFGSYKEELIVIDEKTLIYKREFMVNDGEFPKEDYDDFREFYKEVSKQDNSKIALIKNQL